MNVVDQDLHRIFLKTCKYSKYTRFLNYLGVHISLQTEMFTLFDVRSAVLSFFYDVVIISRGKEPASIMSYYDAQISETNIWR